MSDDNWDIISENLDLDQFDLDFDDVHLIAQRFIGREATPEECVAEFKRLRRKRWEDRKYSKRFKFLVAFRILYVTIITILGVVLWLVN